MEHIKWVDAYNIGIESIDKEHKQLFSTMNKLLEISENEDKSEWVCRQGVKYLKNHALEHFEHEEEYMLSINYSEYEIHKRLHDDFRYKTLPALDAELENSRFSTEAIRHFLGVCIGWVVSHTQTEDQAISGKTVSKWTNLPHESEKEAIENTILELIRDMFHLKGKLISEQYAGEDFGKIICCRFMYIGRQKEEWEITLVYEERLLLKVIGDIMNTDYIKVDEMAIHVMRYISRQFLEQIRERFPAVDLFEIEKESLLTHEQLLNSFKRGQPPFSLLFDTSMGYFAFCADSSDTVHGKVVSSINHSNALNAVKNYITTNTPGHKPKVLVVDDSEFMRKKMIQLLSKDYEMIEADSSISAIKNLAVNRPDLVLLDYEMPVCDGRQALEMMRSDCDIADIPVMFLTGKGDRESVSKVMKLKPEGYLLKSMPDADIKKNIDLFFSKRNKE